MTTPAERPIIFSGEMSHALLTGNKTQTRRVLKEPWKVYLHMTVRGDWPFQGTWAAPGIYEAHHNQHGAVSVKATSNGRMLGIKPAEFQWVTPYGMVGDKLWVREQWRVLGWDDDFSGAMVEYRDGGRKWCDFPDYEEKWQEWLIAYVDMVADLPGVTYDLATEQYKWESNDVIPWKSPIHMPRWASRIALEITDIRVQRLFDISEEDAKAEGVSIEATRTLTHRGAFAITWDSINKKRGFGWEGGTNPWVYALTFQLLKGHNHATA